MIDSLDALELFEWICEQVASDPSATGIYAPRKFARVSLIEPRQVRIDIKAAYSIHYSRCRFGYCGQVVEWVTHRTAHRATWDRLIEDGCVRLGEDGVVLIA